MTTMRRPPTGPQATATRADVERELGPLDEEVLERIIGLGPAVEHLRAARERTERSPADPSRSGSNTERLVEAVRDAVAEGED
jgi:hypothetical protein